MTHNQNWKQIKQIFSTAVELKGTERSEYLEKECAGDSELLNEVQSLLEAYHLPSLLDHSIDHVKDSALTDFDTTRKLGKKAGNYKIIELLGHGGMGSVYLAERADGHFEQKVALKLLRGGFVSDEQVQRFLNERQILASLNHENIARLLDGGVTEEGQPYYVMEYVEGKPIDQYCNQEELSIQERLSLFKDVCSAVLYAHKKLIVHRDLKPSNIFVNNSGKIKLLDFGIAKALDPERLSEDRIMQTQKGILPLTPSYASPEQIRGEPISTASDIYQLGIVLYQLLTGRLPYDVSGKSPGQIEQIICETMPERPSTAVSAMDVKTGKNLTDPADKELSKNRGFHQLTKKLRGDLDSIIMTALRKEPDRRYNSAGELSEDIQKYLSGWPVSAHMDTWGYRSQKFISRNKPAIAAVSVIILLLIGYVVTITWHSQKTQTALEQAMQEASKSEQVIGFLMGMFAASDPSEALGDTVSARVLLERGIEEAESLNDQPEVQAQMFDVVGRVYFELGEYERAYPLLSKALDIHRAAGGYSDIETAHRYYHLGTAMHHTGRYAESDRYFNEAIQLYEMYPGHESVKYASSLYRMAEIRNVRGDFETGYEMHQKALEMRLNLLGETHPHVGASYKGMGATLHQLRDPETAVNYFRKAFNVYKTEYQDNHPSIAELLIFEARTLQVLGELEAAERNLNRAIDIQAGVFGRNHTNTGMSMMALANFYSDRGENAEAEKIYLELELTTGTEPDVNHPLRRPVVQTLARFYMQKGQPVLAEPRMREALSLLESVLNPRSPRVLSARKDLGLCLMELNQFEEAEKLLQQNLNIIVQSDELRQHPAKKEHLDKLVSLYKIWGRDDLAGDYESQLLELAEAEVD